MLAVVGSRVSAESGDSDRSGSSDIAGLVARLRMAGLDVSVEGKAHDSRLSVTGRTLKVDGERVDVYAYDDVWSADSDAAKLIAGNGEELTDWIAASHLFRDERLLIIHPGGSEELNVQLTSVLDSGANLHETR